jgi:hypothetical protein
MREEALQKLTSQEREIRKRIEDAASKNDDNASSQSVMKNPKDTAPDLHSGLNANGEQNKKLKKKPQ